MRQIIKIFGYLFCLIGIFASAAASQTIIPERVSGRYQQFAWQDQHGLPQNGISQIAQTPDGYLWLAIAEGVVRFDGVRFTAFDTGNTPEIKSNNVQSLLVDRRGTLWIGTAGGGLSTYRNDRFEHFSTDDGLSDSQIKCLFEDRSGNLWIGTDGGGLNLFRDGKFTIYSTKNGLPGDRVGAIGEDAAGNLWVGTNGGVARFGNGQFAVFGEREGVTVEEAREFFLDRDGAFWIGGDGLNRFKNGEFTAFGAREGLKNDDIHAIAQGADGALWFGTVEAGLYHLQNERFESATTREGLVNDSIQSIHADATGDLWLGTNGGGLVRLQIGKLSVYTVSDNLPGNVIGAIYEDRAGGVWVGTDQGLSRFKDGKFTVIKAKNNQSLSGVTGISEDGEGNLWISSSNPQTGDKILRLGEGNSEIEIVRDNLENNRVGAVLHDRAGNVWYGVSYDGLHFKGRDGSEKVFHKADGLADEAVSALYEDLGGNVWVGTRAGLSRFKDGVLKTWTAADGFTGKRVLAFHEDRAGNLWIGTDGDGLFRFREDRFVVFTTKNGLYDNLAFSILEDDRGNLWMSGNKGIYRASIAELEEFAAGRRASVNSFSYGAADGMLSRECNGANPAGARTRDGRLWFPTIKGVVVVDPEKTNEAQSSVLIERVLIDEKPLPFGQPVEMQPAEENLEIRFTAISWNRPQQIRFKYKLIGLDTDWVEAGARRTAYYPHIPAGEYTFQVVADNGEGVWNETGKTLLVTVLPPFYQTWWFLVLCLLAAVLSVRLIYSYRLAQLEKINQTRQAFTRQLIESQEQERKRIAVELHDSIGQSLIVIRNRALMSLKAPEKHERTLAQMEEISESAAASIKEVRQIAHNLHPYQLEHLGLTSALETMIETVEKTTAIDFETEIDEVDDALSKEAEINLYRIVQETLNNVVKHSEAKTVKIRLRKTEDNLTLSIADDGKGFSTENGGNRGLGLTGIGERAKMLNADYAIQSVDGKGTTVSLKLDLSKQWVTK